MEISRSKYIISFLLSIALSWMMNSSMLYGQQAGKCDFKNNEFYVEINKKASPSLLDDFIKKYDLGELDLERILVNNNLDTLVKLGWKIISNNPQKLVITRPLTGASDMLDPAGKILNAANPRFDLMFPVVSDEVDFGYNRFKNKHPFATSNQSTRIYLHNNLKARKVMLAGSFNDWSATAQAMKQTDSGWIADLALKPGKYWYKFIVDDDWQVDNDNLLKENDGLGNTNSVFYVTNHVFKLPGYTHAKNVFLAGSFNSWKQKELRMQRTNDGWQLPLYMADGTHRYKFLVDGKWLSDPTNSNALPDGSGGHNSVLAIGKPFHFSLNGYTNAGKVMLAGDFNDWNPEELPMKKTAGGWAMDYVLAPGNYEYKFIVDGEWITDPANPLTVDNDQHTKNSYVVVQPNYTFRIPAFPNAQKVYLAGDFNNWSPNNLLMQKQGNEWVAKVHLYPGKHKYKLVVDGEWLMDPTNKLWEQNEYGTGNSVLWFDNKL